jgi:hypothetical protein
MAWRIHEHILRGEIDNRSRGRVTGRIWLAGVAEPLILELRGDCAPDLAGRLVTFENPQPAAIGERVPAREQLGWVGDITAAQKVRVPDVPIAEFIAANGDAPWHWARSLYLEWFSKVNGRVVVQTTDFTLQLSEPAWTISQTDYRASREQSAQEHCAWMQEEFGPLEGEVRVVNLGGLPREPADDEEEEAEAWKPADDSPAEPRITPRAMLILRGFTPLAVTEVDYAPLRGRLWELIYALAGCGIFLQRTDHLSDIALYEWLDAFLDLRCAEPSPDGSAPVLVDVCDVASGSDHSTHCWLTCHATADERKQWAEEHPGAYLPPSEKPRHDRDRFLPEPPQPPPEWSPPEEADATELDDVDREIRIEKLKAEIAGITDGDFVGGAEEEMPPAIEEAFLESVLEFERAGTQRPIDQLAASGGAPLPPAELTDELFTPKLWELLHALACRGFYLLHTDHLGDRALYTALWEQGLRDDALLPGRNRRCGWFHDCIGSYGPDEMEIFHRYYETAEERARHLAEFPDDKLPARETPPHSRDWRLPKGPF